jgi:hypothetical protein
MYRITGHYHGLILGLDRLVAQGLLDAESWGTGNLDNYPSVAGGW